MKKLFYLFAISILLIGCETEQNAKQKISVLVIGNSITKSNPIPELGWYGNCGMASSSLDKDFCSQLTYKLQDNYQIVELDRLNLAIWEHNFNYDYTPQIDLSKSYDYIVIDTGENVLDLANYRNSLTNLIDDFKTAKTKVILTSCAWEKDEIDNAHLLICQEKGYKYCDISFMHYKDEYYAKQYENGAVAAHPNDKGMLYIAERLYLTVKLTE